MVSFREMQINKWDKEYRQKGSLWHGPPHIDVEIPENSRVLDIGCGNGKTLSALLKLNCKITAIDSSKRAVELCREVAERSGRREIEILVADVCELPFSDSYFDIILAFHILEHLLEEDRKKAISEIIRVLAPSGKLLIKVFSTNDMRFGKGIKIEKNTFMRGNRLIYHYFTKKELKENFRGLKENKNQLLIRSVTYGKKRFKREVIFAIYEKKEKRKRESVFQ